MATVTREAIMAGVFTKLQTLSGFNTFTRRFTPRADLPLGSLPILMMIEDGDPERVGQAGPAGQRRFMGLLLIVAFQNTNKSISGSTILNPLIDAIDNLFNTPDNQMSGRYTVGGLVAYARVEGMIHKQSGDIDADNIGGAVIPIKILIP